MDAAFDSADLPLVKTWAEWGEVFTDVDIWEEAVREIGRRVGLPVRSIKPGYPGSNAVFIVNRGTPDGAAVKIYAPLCPEDYDLERVLHPVLCRWPEIGAPRLMAEGSLGEEGAWPYVVLSLVPGEPIREVREDLPDRDLLAVSRDLGRRLRVLHGIPIASLSLFGPGASDWPRVAERHLAQTIEKLRNRKTLPRVVLDAVPGFVHAALEASENTDLVLVSGDVTEDHVLLVQQDGRWSISGLIDFADAMIAPRAYEWVALWFGALDRDATCLNAFLAGYGSVVVDSSFYRNAMAFTFLHEFGGEIITDELRRLGKPPLTNLSALQAALWEPD